MPTTRRAGSDDVEAIVALGVANQMFTSAEADDFRAQLADPGADGLTVVAEVGATVVGAAHVAPEGFADRVWNLLFLATAPEAHGTGAGTVLVGEVEARLRAAGEGVARVLVVDTSSAAGYDEARRFYLARGFVEEARVRGWYGPDDDKVTFWKELGSAGSSGHAIDTP